MTYEPYPRLPTHSYVPADTTLGSAPDALTPHFTITLREEHGKGNTKEGLWIWMSQEIKSWMFQKKNEEWKATNQTYQHDEGYQ